MPRTKYKKSLGLEQHTMKARDLFIGIDNGVTGSLGFLFSDHSRMYIPTPTKKEQNYTKTKKNVTRIDHRMLLKALSPHAGLIHMCLIERPMVNPTRFQASASALRAMEATLIILEVLQIPYSYIDSKEWQKDLLPKGIKGAAELKKASMDISLRMFPDLEKVIRKQKDGDGILIAEYCRRTYG